MAAKNAIFGRAIGTYDPAVTAGTIRPRAAGETEAEYRRYVQLMQGDAARTAATHQGTDTSGMYWDGDRFRDANADHWYSDPRVLGPIATSAASFGFGALGAPGAASVAAAASRSVPQIVSQAANRAVPAGVAAITGASSTPVWLEPVLKYGVPAAGSFLSAKMQSGAAKYAADLNATAVREAQAIERTDHAESVKRNAPYYDLGQQAVRHLGDLLGSGNGTPAATAPAVRPAESMVTLRAPNGQTQAVPASQVDHFVSRGARVVE